MKKILIAAVVIALTSTSVLAHGSRHYRPYAYHSYGYGHRHNYGAWVAGAIGLGVLGAVIYDQYGRRCVNQIVGYDQLGNPITRQVCN